MTWVVDASVALKWLIPEALSEQADRVRDGEEDIVAPDLLVVEAAHALWRKSAAREISPREADTALALLKHSGIDLRPTPPLVERAMELARRFSHPVYDCTYLALAERERARFVTADQRLLRRLSSRTLNIWLVDLRTL